jgi:prepilin-type processing-associated H-X9-DG protein
VELLVVIAVIAMLVGLLLPAVQSARETARRIHCSNSYKQVTLAVLQHASAHSEKLPSQWHPMFGDEPWRGEFLSWRYTVLPFMEEQAMFDALSSGKWFFAEPPTAPRGDRFARVAAYQCPSSPGDPFFLPNTTIHVRGNNKDLPIFDAIATNDNYSPWQILSIKTGATAGAWFGLRHIPSFNGMPELRPNDVHLTPAGLKYVTDGLSKTVLVAEMSHSQRVNRDHSRDLIETWFLGGVTTSDHGIGVSINRYNGDISSSHPGGAHAAMCDGSVHFLYDDTSEAALGAMLGRQDNK